MPRRKTDADQKFDVEVGRRIEAARRRRKMMQLSLAVRVGITQQQLSWYEAGRNGIPVATLARIGAALQVDTATLLPEIQDVVVRS